MFWSMLVNVGLYVGVSLFSRQSAAEHSQAALFVDAFREPRASASFWRGSASVADLRALLARFGDEHPAAEALALYEPGPGRASGDRADAELVHNVERLLAGSIGAASARVMIASIVDEEPLGIDEVMDILEETSQAIAHSRELEEKSRALEAATTELRAANARLQELDRLKDDFVSTVTHELRTPLTSMRAFAEILLDNPDLPEAERERFLRIVIEEVARLTRLINQVLDLSKLESGREEFAIGEVDLAAVVHESAAGTAQVLAERGAELSVELPSELAPVLADRDRVKQVLINLLSNAAKFCAPVEGKVTLHVAREDGRVRVDVSDNGPGIAPEDLEVIFEKFRQGGQAMTDRPSGTGLGLPISRHIVRRLGGELWVESAPGQGATMRFTLPLARTELAEPHAGAAMRGD
jgi:signal transduction histidine kinase